MHCPRPYVAGLLATECAVKQEVVSWNLKLVQQHISIGSKPWASIGSGFDAWLREACPDSVLLVAREATGDSVEGSDGCSGDLD